MSVRFRAYLAASLDGYIADRDGGVTFLEDFNPADYGYQAFAGSIATIVMGRVTYEQSLGYGPAPWGDKETIVLSSRPLAGVATAHDPRVLAERLREAGRGDVWIMGGGRTLRGFLEAGAVDELDLYLIPVLLGDGIRLFEPTRAQVPVRLVEASAQARGVVRLLYAAGARAA